jgi:hypothetical protein
MIFFLFKSRESKGFGRKVDMDPVEVMQGV